MAKLTFDIPDTQIDRVAIALGYVGGEGLTKAQKIKQEIGEMVKLRVKDYEQSIAQQQVRDSVTDINIT